MALTRTNQIGAISTDGHGTGAFVTSSFTPPNNSLLVVFGGGMDVTGSAGLNAALTMAGGGLTFTSRVSVEAGGGGAFSIATVIWTAPVTTGASMTLTLDAAARNLQFGVIHAVAYTGYDTGTPTGATGTVTDTASADGAQSITLSGAPATDSEVFASMTLDKETTAVTPGSTFTELYESQVASTGGGQTQIRTGSTSTTVDWIDTNTGAGNTFKISAAALEIKASGAPPTNITRVAVTTGAPANASAFSPTLPTHASGDRMVLAVVGKYDTTTVPTINQGWTLVKSGTGGTGSTGNDTGLTFWAVYAKDAQSGSETAPTVTPGGTAPNSWEWICASHRPGSGRIWLDAIGASVAWVQSASDTNTASPLTGTAGAWTGVQPTADDAIFAVGVIPTDLGTALGATTITATGLSGGTKDTTTTNYIENAFGNDTAAVWAGWTGFTGTASAGLALSFTVTGATNQSGSLVGVALRQVVGSSGSASLNATATTTAVGQVQGTAARSITATITAAGQLTASGSAALNAVATITAAGGSEVPETISGLALWWLAEDLSGLSDGAAVGTSGVSPWVSRAGTASALQATSGNRPTKQTVSSETCVRFDGTDDSLALDGDALTATQNRAAVTVLVKAKVNALPTGVAFFAGFSVGNSAFDTRVSLRTDLDAKVVGLHRRTDLPSSSQIVLGGSYSTGTIHTFSTAVDFANTDCWVWLNGTEVASETAFLDAGTTTNTASLAATIGSGEGGGENLSGDIYEVLVYNRVLNGTERAALETYLAGSGGLSGSAAPTWTAAIAAAGNMSASGQAAVTGTAAIAASGQGRGSSSPTWTASITAAGVLTASGSANVSETTAITAAGQAQGSAARSTTAAITAAGNMSAVGSAARGATASISSSGRTEGSSSPSWTATISAAGGLGALSGSAARNTTASISVAGQVQGSSSLTWTASIVATGVLTASGSAAVSETATILASGQGQGTAARSTTAAIASSGQARGSASLSETASISGTGRAEGFSSPVWTATISAEGGPPGTGSAALNVVATITASGVLSASGSASLAETASITALGAGQGTAARSTTVSVASSGLVQGSASLSETAAISSSGRTEGSAALNVVAAISASGNMSGGALSGTSSSTWTASIAAAGQLQGSGAATVVTTATITAAGVLTASGSAALSITASRTAAGRIEGSASRSTTATVTSSGRTEGSASLNATVSITAVGRLTVAGSATLNAVATIVAAGYASGVGILPAAPSRVSTGHQMSRVTVGAEMSAVRTGHQMSRVETGEEATRVSTEWQMSRVLTEIG